MIKQTYKVGEIVKYKNGGSIQYVKKYFKCKKIYEYGVTNNKDMYVGISHLTKTTFVEKIIWLVTLIVLSLCYNKKHCL